MDISISGADIAIRTPFNDAYDLVQVLRGVQPALLTRNEPVDFRMAGLVRRGHRDIWHVDRVLAFSTDECSPFVINGEDIGGNHGEPCAMLTRLAKHGLDCRAIGTWWADDAGMRWTLLRTEGPDALFFLSENTGPSEAEYAFANHITGTLHCLDAALPDVLPEAQHPGQQLTRAIRHLRCEVTAQVEGVWRPIAGGCEGANRARITEEYEVICPSTVAKALRQARPSGGYTAPQSLGVGKAMAIHRMTYQIEPDGAILCDFDHEVTMPVRLTWYLGIMYQEKCDAFGGGVHRVIPKLRPFAHQGVAYDFSRPYDTTHGSLPETCLLTPDMWQHPDFPPDRQIDLLQGPDGASPVAFAGGFLPVYDGAPAIRSRNITDAGDLVASRKTYPTFAGGKANARPIQRLRGVAYKRYLTPRANGQCAAYTVPYGGATYLYLEFFADTPTRQTWDVPPGAHVVPLECSGVTWERTERGLCAAGRQGYAVFRIE